MRAVVFNGLGNGLAVQDVADPVPGPGEVVIRVEAVGVCGSDLHATEDGAFLQEKGTILGHEFSGEVIASDDPSVRVGLRATAVPVDICEACRPFGVCREGLHAVCPKSNFTGLALNVPGAYAEKVAVLGSRVIPLPDEVSFEEGATVEPLAVGLHAVDMSGMFVGARVLIIGAGPIGLSVSTFASLAGAGSVVVSEFAETRRKAITGFGATHTIDPNATPDVAAAFATLTGAPPDIIFDCVGVPGTLQSCIDISRPRGTIVVVGVCMKPDEVLPMVAALKELRVQFTMAYEDADFGRVLSLMKAQKIDAKKMISTRVGLEALPEAFEKLRKPSGQIKLIANPQT